MRLFRTLSTRRLISVLAVLVAIAIATTAAAVAARGGSGPTPPAKPLGDAIHDALSAQAPVGITARIQFTNNLFPSGALVGQSSSPLMASASGRLWATANGGRLELQSDAGDAQIVWSTSKVTVYDGTSNTAYTFDLPKSTETSSTGTHATPTLDEITKFLADAGAHWTISGAQPDNIASQEAYRVDISPKHDGGLLGSAELAWDASHGVPLRVAIYAQGSSSPVVALEATHIDFGSVSSSTIDVTPPAGAKVVDLSSSKDTAAGGAAAVVGAAAVRTAAPWAVVPQSLVGLPLQDVRLVGPADSRASLAVYGQGLGAVVVLEHQKGTEAKPTGSSPLGSLPTVSLDGVDAHELVTQLGSALAWDRAGVSYVLAGSVPSAAAEAAARALR